MKSIKNAIFPIAIGFVLFGIDLSVVMADVTYTYAGKKFTQVNGNYTTSQKITGSFTLLAPLMPSSIFTINLPVFSFSDGTNKLNDQNISEFANRYLETDANGNIKYWSLVFSKYEPDPPKVFGKVRSIQTSHDNFSQIPSFDLGSIGMCLEVMGDLCTLSNWGNFDFGASFNAGTWKISKSTASSSKTTGYNISKSARLAYFVRENALFLTANYVYAQFLIGTCPITLGASCFALATASGVLAAYQAWQLGQIINDPPDPLYSEVFQPRQYQAFTLDSSSGFSSELIDAANTAFRDRTELASLLEAWRITLERYSAAKAANDQTNLLLQAKALDSYIIQTSRLATLAQQSFDEFIDQLEELTGPVVISPDQVQTAMSTLAQNGFNDLELDGLSSFSLSSTEIEEVRSMLLQTPPLSDTVDFYSVMRSTEGSYGELSAITRYVIPKSCNRVPKVR